MLNANRRICPNNILEARKSLDMSQKEVALSLSVAAPSVSNWERCLKYPEVENLIQLSKLFEMSTDYLLCLSNKPSLGNAASPDWNGNLLYTIRTEREESIEHAAEAIGIPVYLYSKYENCEAEPCLSDLIAIAEHFCISYEELLWRRFSLTDSNERVTVGEFRISSDEKHLIERYRQLNSDGQDCVKSQFELVLGNPQFQRNKTITLAARGGETIEAPHQVSEEMLTQQDALIDKPAEDEANQY